MAGNALFGFTGFVGSNLRNQTEFEYLFNSQNSQTSYGRKFDSVVFSAAKAEKWRANKEPEADRKHITELKEIIDGVHANRFVLISTVDVYKTPVQVNESSAIDRDNLHPYGLHRLELEEHVRKRFPDALVVRLPGLFGPGLKKNVIFDLIHNNEVSKIQPDSVIQYYDVTQLWEHINLLNNAGIRLANLVSAPIETARLASSIFDIQLPQIADSSALPAAYDVRTEHSELFGSVGNYDFSAESTLRRIASFVKATRL